MAKEKKETITIGDETVKGFRKGMTKRKIVQSMNEDDWKRLDQMKKAEELKVTNEYAHKCWIKSDQLHQEFFRKKVELEEIVVNIELRDSRINQLLIDIEKEDDFYVKNKMLLEISELNAEALKGSASLHVTLFNLYVFVGRIGLDKEVMFTEEQYNQIAKNAMDRVQKTQFHKKL